MVSLKKQIVSALKADSTLQSLFSGGDVRVHFYAPDSDVYPCIGYSELVNQGQSWHDDSESSTKLAYNVDVWSLGDTTDLANAVEAALGNIGLVREFAIDLQETDEAQRVVYQKNMRFVTVLEV